MPPDPAQLAASWKAPERIVPRTVEYLDWVVPVPSKVTNPLPVVEQLVQSLDRMDRFAADASRRSG